MHVSIRDGCLGKVRSPVEELKELGISSVELFIGRDMQLLPLWGSEQKKEGSNHRLHGLHREGQTSPLRRGVAKPGCVS